MTGHFLISAILIFCQANSNSGTAADQDGTRSALDVAQRREREQELVIRKLVATASDKDELHVRRQIALEALANYRSAAANSGLLENLLFNEAIITTQHPLANRPAAKSLASIGSAAYPQIWERINRECVDDYIFVLAHTIFHIDGKAVALTRLKEKRDAPDTTKQQKANVEKLLKLFETVDFRKRENWP
jgi:hypothetical protein